MPCSGGNERRCTTPPSSASARRIRKRSSAASSSDTAIRILPSCSDAVRPMPHAWPSPDRSNVWRRRCVVNEAIDEAIENIVDGAPVDWSRIERGAAAGPEPAWADDLRIIHDVANFYRLSAYDDYEQTA